MVAQNKDDFLFQLHNELHRIGIDADEEIFADFEEHFKASSMEGLSEEETCRRLGDVKEIARSYIDIESSRLNSIVAQAIEADRPHVSLTKPGRDVPADLSLVKDKPEEKPAEETPIREYTPEHISEEIYPEKENKSAHVDLSKTAEAASSNESEKTAETESVGQNDTTGGSASETAGAGSESNSGNGAGTGSGEQSIADAFAAAGMAAASAAKSAGHAIAEAFGSDSMKDAGRSAAEAIKTAGHATAEAIKNAAETAKAEHEERKAHADDVPRPNDSFRENCSQSSEGYIPPQKDQSVNTGKGFKFTDLKGMKMNPNAGKLFGAILMDVLLWSWLLCMLISIAIGLFSGAFGTIGSGCAVIFAGTGFFFISRLFLGIGIISLGVIILLLAFLLVKGIIHMIKNIVMMHVKALYDI